MTETEKQIYEERIRRLADMNDQLVTTVLEMSRYIREMERMQRWNRLNMQNTEK
jgi:RNase P subunit RPR2